MTELPPIPATGFIAAITETVKPTGGWPRDEVWECDACECCWDHQCRELRCPPFCPCAER